MKNGLQLVRYCKPKIDNSKCVAYLQSLSSKNKDNKYSTTQTYKA